MIFKESELFRGQLTGGRDGYVVLKGEGVDPGRIDSNEVVQQTVAFLDHRSKVTTSSASGGGCGLTN